MVRGAPRCSGLVTRLRSRTCGSAAMPAMLLTGQTGDEDGVEALASELR
jgi:hypothetical protein